MKLRALMVGLGLSGVAMAAGAQGFRVDVSKEDFYRQAGLLTVGSLAVGEKGLVTTYGVRLCKDSDGMLRLSAHSKLKTDIGKYSYILEIERVAGGMVNINPSSRGKKFDVEGGIESLNYAIQAVNCDSEFVQGEKTFPVNNFFGKSSLSSALMLLQSNVAQKEEVKAEAVPVIAPGVSLDPDWLVSESKSEIDDSPSVSMFMTSEGTDRGRETLILRCKENTTDAFVTTGKYLGSEISSVLIRFDKTPAYTQRVNSSTSSKAFFVKKPIQFIKKLTAHNKMVVRYAAYSGSESTASFVVKGAEDGLAKLRKACNW